MGTCAIRRSLVSAAALTAVVFAVGCGKQRTQWSLKSAKSHREKAVGYKADSYHPEELKALTGLIDQAETSMNGGQFAQSVELAKQAVAKGKDLVDHSRMTHSTKLQERSNGDMDVARANEGRAENAQLYSEIEALLAEINTKHPAGKHDDSSTCPRRSTRR